MLDEMGVEATGGKALATSEEFIKGLELYQPADEVGSRSPKCCGACGDALRGLFHRTSTSINGTSTLR